MYSVLPCLPLVHRQILASVLVQQQPVVHFRCNYVVDVTLHNYDYDSGILLILYWSACNEVTQQEIRGGRLLYTSRAIIYFAAQETSSPAQRQ